MVLDINLKHHFCFLLGAQSDLIGLQPFLPVSSEEEQTRPSSSLSQGNVSSEYEWIIRNRYLQGWQKSKVFKIPTHPEFFFASSINIEI